MFDNFSYFFHHPETRKKAYNMMRFAFSHHPTCGYYKEDTFYFHRVYFCKGCSLGYPAFIISFIAIFMFEFSTSLLTSLVLIIFSTFLILFLLSQKFNFFRNFKRAFVGIFSGSYFVLLFRQHNIFLIIGGLIIFYMLLMFMTYLRYRKMQKICKICEFEGNWDVCPGFEELRTIILANTKWAKSEDTISIEVQP